MVHHLLGCVDMAGCNQVLERSLVFGHPLDLLVLLLLVDPAAVVDNSEDIGLEGQVCHIPEEEVHLDVLPEEAVHRNYLMNILDHRPGLRCHHYVRILILSLDRYCCGVYRRGLLEEVVDIAKKEVIYCKKLDRNEKEQKGSILHKANNSNLTSTRFPNCIGSITRTITNLLTRILCKLLCAITKYTKTCQCLTPLLLHGITQFLGTLLN